MSVSDLEEKIDPPSPSENASTAEIIRHRLKAKEERKTYTLRKQTGEPLFEIIKEVIGFRQFHLRGHPQVETEWTVGALAYNMKRLFNMAGRCSYAEKRLDFSIQPLKYHNWGIHLTQVSPIYCGTELFLV